MTPDDLKAIDEKLLTANTVFYRTWGEEDTDAEYDIERLVAEVRQLYKDNILLQFEATRLRIALEDVMLAVNVAAEQGSVVRQVRVIVTRALYGKGAG